MTFKITDGERDSLDTSTSVNTQKSRSKSNKSTAKFNSGNEGKSEGQHKKKENDNQTGPSDLIERLRRITMKYERKKEGGAVAAEKQATDDSAGGNASPTPAKEVDINENEKVEAEATTDDSISVTNEKRVGSESMKTASSDDDSIKTEVVEKTEKRREGKATPEVDDSEIDNIAAAYTAVDATELDDLNNGDAADDDDSAVLNPMAPKPIEKKGRHDGVLFFNPGVYGMIVNMISNSLLTWVFSFIRRDGCSALCYRKRAQRDWWRGFQWDKWRTLAKSEAWVWR